jgi:hypothetical protein
VTLPTQTACHEAGHCVIAKALGLPTRSIVLKLKREGRTASGESDVHFGPDRVGPSSALDRAMVSYAGWYAQVRAYPGCDKRGSESDLGVVKLVLMGQPKGTRERLIRRVKKLLAENWAAVLALAHEIDLHGTLDTPDLERLGYWWEGSEQAWLRIN